MPRRYWLPIIAVVGLISAAQAQQPIKGQGTTPGAAVANKAPQDKAKPPELLPLQHSIDGVRAAIEAATNKKETAEEKGRAKQDLNAQLVMARAAQKMFWVGVAETAITFTGVLLVLVTLLYTRQAANEAKRAADAAHLALSQAERHARQGLRAYLLVSRASIAITNNGLLAYIEVKNSGQTPAKNVRFSAALRYGNAEGPEYVDGEIFPQTSAIGSQATHDVSVRVRESLPDHWLRDYSQGRQLLIAYGRIEYEDVFGVQQHTTFKGRVIGSPMKGEGQIWPSDDGNDAT